MRAPKAQAHILSASGQGHYPVNICEGAFYEPYRSTRPEDHALLYIPGRKPGDLHRHLFGVLQYRDGKVKNMPRDERKSPAA